MNYETIASRIEGGIARLTLNRPDKLNSFTAAMHPEVRAALAELSCRPLGARAGADRRRPRLLRRTGPGRPRRRTGRRWRGPGRRQSRSYYAPAGAGLAQSADAGASAPSTAWPPARAPTWRWPATSCWPRNRPASSKSFCKLGLIPDTGGTWHSCRAWSARPAPWAWPCWATNSAPSRPSNGD